MELGILQIRCIVGSYLLYITCT